MKNKQVLAKTISWYIFHFLMVSLLGKIITADWTIGVKIASAEMVVESFLFYLHEHLWVRIKNKWH